MLLATMEDFKSKCSLNNHYKYKKDLYWITQNKLLNKRFII
jgi:hypothetical protein